MGLEKKNKKRKKGEKERWKKEGEGRKERRKEEIKRKAFFRRLFSVIQIEMYL